MSGFSIPKLNCISRARKVLDASKSLRYIVEVCSRCVANFLALPVWKCVHKPMKRVRQCPQQAKKSLEAHRSLTPPVISASAVPLANMFQLSAVPIKTLGNVVSKSLIFVNSSSPVKFPRYSVSEPTVMPYTALGFAGMAFFRASLSAL